MMRSRKRRRKALATLSVFPVGRQDTMEIVAHQEKRQATSLILKRYQCI